MDHYLKAHTQIKTTSAKARKSAKTHKPESAHAQATQDTQGGTYTAPLTGHPSPSKSCCVRARPKEQVAVRAAPRTGNATKPWSNRARPRVAALYYPARGECGARHREWAPPPLAPLRRHTPDP